MKLLIVEDEVKTVAYLKRGLSEKGFTVDSADNGEDGLHLAMTGDYDVIILDFMLPERDGVSLLQALRTQKTTPVIMLTARDSVSDRLRGLGAGADDYLVKPFSFLELLARVQAVLRRSRQQDITQIDVGDLHIDLVARRATRRGRKLSLTAKEFALLAALAQRKSQIVSKTEITELVWDVNFDTNTNVVEVAIRRLRTKIETPGEARLLHTIRGMGYMLELREEDTA